MAGKQVMGDGVPSSLAGMSKNQLYDIMSQMKALIAQNQQQARLVLIQNPALTRALFQAQIMLGMVQPPQAQPNIQPASSFPGQIRQNQTRKLQLSQTVISGTSVSIPTPVPQSQSMPSQPFQSVQQPKGPIGAQSTSMLLPQSSQVPNISQLPHHSAPHPPSHLHAPMPSASTQSQQPMQNMGPQYPPSQPPQQTPLPTLSRPQISSFGHQVHPQLGPNMGFQHPGGPPLHHSQHAFHSGNKPPASMVPSFPQGQPSFPSHSLLPSLYQGGGPQLGMEFSQAGSTEQTDRGSPWIPGLPENATGTQLPGPPVFPGQLGPGNQPPPLPSLSPEMEKALLQQVMSLTPEQINMLPSEQRNQILQLQQALRQ
ncbi:cleavage stimulating factor 64-like isoform X2 [Olea europaea var. sylvestris]|uniref:Cleavage stimulating factor 64 n=1 Tax=Olea europaea subsp. europaea TaxID=158383 RepID=A0A8S0Q387_OLEEU|nr:cleavage stimulating factor 64-like isoform X2 [Olea europaea var. sylvestris]CAA2961388.1 cleavage stimulating factor 64 [Olea europaea subsp. europaea]